MNGFDFVLVGVSIALLFYLLLAMLAPEKFS